MTEYPYEGDSPDLQAFSEDLEWQTLVDGYDKSGIPEKLLDQVDDFMKHLYMTIYAQIRAEAREAGRAEPNEEDAWQGLRLALGAASVAISERFGWERY